MKRAFLLSGAALAASFTLFAACSSDSTDTTTTDTDAAVTPDAGKDSSTSDAGPACGAGQLACGGSCVNTQKDVNNCGACGKTCGADEACEAGKCALHCPAGTAVCGSRCVALDTDATNCGACGKTCAAGSVCSAGKCAVTCAADLTTCSGANAADAGAPADAGASDAGAAGPYCANAKTDRNNCGGCGIKCGAGEICEAGACKLSCGGGTLQCGNRCIDPTIDANNCGGCGAADATKKCGAGSYCSNSTCCTGGKTGCNGACIDQNTDPNNCGGCGIVCGAAAPLCSNGACTNNPCPGGQLRSGYCWFKAKDLNEGHDAACARNGKATTPLHVAVPFNLADVDALAAGFGAQSAGVYSCCANALWCNAATNQCGTHGVNANDYWNYGGYGDPAWLPVYTCMP